MHGLLRMVAVLLLLTMATALPGAHVLPFSVTQSGHPAKCHGHGPATPSPAPTSYQCCVNGHQAAIPNAAFSLRSSLGSVAAQVDRLDGRELSRLDFVRIFRSGLFVVPSISPPDAAPLRI
jgi:hypothetical protein